MIVEDEPMAQASLCRTLLKNYPDIEVTGMTGSVAETVSWLKNPGNSAELIFMDVELSDGNCFDIFRQTQIEAKVIITTAYDTYAVRAFEVNSIDYLLKPIGKEELDRAIDRCRRASANTDVSAIAKALDNNAPAAAYRQRFIVKMNDKIIPVPVSNIAFFLSEDKVTWLYTFDGARYVADSFLDALEGMLDPTQFYRISRGCIISSSAVVSIVKLLGGRLKVNTNPQTASDIIVSRSRSEDFISWLGSV